MPKSISKKALRKKRSFDALPADLRAEILNARHFDGTPLYRGKGPITQLVIQGGLSDEVIQHPTVQDYIAGAPKRTGFVHGYLGCSARCRVVFEDPEMYDPDTKILTDVEIAAIDCDVEKRLRVHYTVAEIANVLTSRVGRHIADDIFHNNFSVAVVIKRNDDAIRELLAEPSYAVS
jgi:hypothetical protein